jgi:hypothetical protein
MATPIGTNTMNSISRRFLFDQVVDNVYLAIPAFFRLNAMNKKIVQGGFQVEVPLMFSKFAAGGFYQGYDLLDITPSDTVKNAAFDWKQAYVPVTVSGLDLIRADSPEAVVNLLRLQFEQAQMQLADQIGFSLWTDAVTNQKNIDGLKGAVDDGTVAPSYGGITRSSNVFWKSQIDSATTTMTLAALNTLFGNCQAGGRTPTVIFGTQANYNRYWALNTSGQAFPVQPAGHDAQLAQSGFSNLVFNGVPFLVDSNVPANHVFMLNENYMYLLVHPRGDFDFNEFREPVNQDAMTALILWAGNLILTNCARQGKLTALVA